MLKVILLIIGMIIYALVLVAFCITLENNNLKE